MGLEKFILDLLVALLSQSVALLKSRVLAGIELYAINVPAGCVAGHGRGWALPRLAPGAMITHAEKIIRLC